MPFINETLAKGTMKRTKLHNKFLLDRVDKKRYSLQRNYCVSLLRKTKKNIVDILAKKVTDNIIF